MSTPIKIRHVASIAGVVQDRVTKARIGAALVQIVEGPPAYQVMLVAQAADPDWRKRRQRLDRVTTHADGIFTLTNLPPGAYRLRISAPDYGSRYGGVDAGPIDVKPAPEAGPVPVAQLTIDLPPTTIHGTITRKVNGKTAPVPRARVHLRGDTAVALSGDDGRYRLTQIVQGKPTLEASVAGLAAQTRTIEIQPGQERQEDFRFD